MGSSRTRGKRRAQTIRWISAKRLVSDLQDFNDYEDERLHDDDHRLGLSSLELAKPIDHDVEEWDIRSSIGLDCTLDYEVEEDEFDKVATGQEKAGDCLYSSDATDYGTGVNSYSEIPNTFKNVIRDPGANQVAAKIRLEEDAEATQKF